MIAFKPKNPNFSRCQRPEDTKKIWEYLNDLGEIYLNPIQIEQKWESFSRRVFLDKLKEVNEDNLKDFADYLEEIEI